MKFIPIFIALSLLVGCQEREITATRKLTLEVIAVHPKSKQYSTIDLKDTRTPLVYKNKRVYCNSTQAKNIHIGSKWDVTEVDYKYGDRYGSELIGLRGICEKSN